MAAAVPSSASTAPGPALKPTASAGTPAAAPVPPLSGSLRMSGASRVPNVRTLAWTASGFTKVAGDVEVETGDVHGSLAVGGKLVAKQLELSGTNRVVGEIQISDRCLSKGSLRAGASVSARRVELNGTVEIVGALTVAEDLRLNGTLDVGGDVRAGSMIFVGRLAVEGTLTARSISGEVESLSSVGEIHADWMEIHMKKSRLPFAVPFLPPPAWHELEVRRVEANEVHLAGVRVRYLKADRVWLGPDTHVEYVEGTIVQQHKDAHVGPESESSPPPGLSR